MTDDHDSSPMFVCRVLTAGSDASFVATHGNGSVNKKRWNRKIPAGLDVHASAHPSLAMRLPTSVAEGLRWNVWKEGGPFWPGSGPLPLVWKQLRPHIPATWYSKTPFLDWPTRRPFLLRCLLACCSPPPSSTSSFPRLMVDMWLDTGFVSLARHQIFYATPPRSAPLLFQNFQPMI